MITAVIIVAWVIGAVGCYILIRGSDHISGSWTVARRALSVFSSALMWPILLLFHCVFSLVDYLEDGKEKKASW